MMVYIVRGCGQRMILSSGAGLVEIIVMNMGWFGKSS